MIRIEKLNEMLEAIYNERGISKEILKEAITDSILSACKRKFTNHDNLRAEIDEEGEVKILAKRTVIEEPTNPEIEISLADAQKIDKTLELGGSVDIDVTPHDFGRMAAQTAKQVIIQRIREAEKDKAFEEFSQKQGDLLTGTIQRKEGAAYLINLGRVETLLVPQEQIPGENLRINDHVKLYVTEVKRTSRGPLVMISRNHPGLVEKLFELEVPEIAEKTLEIKGIAREAGRRTKIAIQSNDKNVTAVGTCVGHMGNRIQNIVRELGNNERVDIIEWNANVSAFISNALSPAKISGVSLDEKEKIAKVFVAESQLSLAIGKEGQNVRLASKLTGWKIDIGSDEEAKKAAEAKAAPAPIRSGPAEKIKIHELAKELKIPSKKLIEELKTLKIEVKGATSSISPEEKQKLLQSLKETKKIEETNHGNKE
ncbi:MAG: transcription termination factor NusA [Candidatus Saganbacteria bacterium]|nr:transcription termination factor NusA [Candidatus Saganbacteria bacterium]